MTQIHRAIKAKLKHQPISNMQFDSILNFLSGYGPVKKGSTPGI